MVKRHGATEIQVLTKRSGQSYLLRVSENGTGAEDLFEAGSLEVLDLHERARRVGGKIEIERTRNGGSVVTIKARQKIPKPSPQLS